MSTSMGDFLDRVRRGDIPTTDEFAKELAEIQEELKVGAPDPKAEAETFRIVQLDKATERALLTLVLKRLEESELRKMIVAIETMRRQLGRDSILFKRMGDYL